MENTLSRRALIRALPAIPAAALLPAAASAAPTIAEPSPGLILVLAHTELMGGPVHARQYKLEVICVDPEAELRDGLHVIQFRDSQIGFLEGLQFTGRDENGRFVQAGDPRECYLLVGIGIKAARAESVIKIVGRYVGPARPVPMKG